MRGDGRPAVLLGVRRRARPTVLRRFLVPALAAAGDVDAPARSAGARRRSRGTGWPRPRWRWRCWTRSCAPPGSRSARYLGAVQDRGAVRGVGRHQHSVAALLDAVGGYLDAGLRADQAEDQAGLGRRAGAGGAGAVRRRLLLQVDANTAYTLADARHLARLDAFDLLLIEQPLAEEDLRQHAELARLVRTPICLDESITSARAAADAIALGACSVINIKPGRVGGYLEARRIHDVCAANGIPVWCGGMLETGLGRAANVALAALPGFTLPGDTSASDRFYQQDISANRCAWTTVTSRSRPGPGWECRLIRMRWQR